MLAACERLAVALPVAAEAGIHRDFYADQVIVDGDRTWLVDLDLYAAGDPALDVGNFLAHIEERAVREPAAAPALHAAAAAFAARYGELDGGESTARVVSWTLLALARLVHISTEITAWRRFTRAVLARWEDLSRQARRDAGGGRS